MNQKVTTWAAEWRLAGLSIETAGEHGVFVGGRRWRRRLHLYADGASWALTLADPRAKTKVAQYRELRGLKLEDALDQASEFLRGDEAQCAGCEGIRD